MVTAIIITKNEEKNIETCLRALGFADEILIVDDYSTDKTIVLAEKYGARVVKNKLNSFSEQRNFGLERVSNEWVLFVDADEMVSKNLGLEIKEKIDEEKFDGYYIKREDVFLGRKMYYGDLSNVWLLRLGRKSKGKWKGDVHEEWEIKGDTSRLSNPLTHTSHENLKDFIGKINVYSTLRAKELKKEGIKSSLLTIILYPKIKFIYLYILKFGFADGLHGFVHAVLMSIYSFLVRAKLYQLSNEN